VTATRSGDQVTLYVSWNGATDVRSWVVGAGNTTSINDMNQIGAKVAKTGFETVIKVTSSKKYFSVGALDKGSYALAVSEAVTASVTP
jgi:hypothetical protein